MNQTLNYANVNKLYLHCSFSETETFEEYLVAPCILSDSCKGFHKDRLRDKKDMVIAMLAELPEKFKDEQGESFSNAFLDKNGKVWADKYETMEKLFLLGVAIGAASYTTPREKWKDFFQHSPYIVINSTLRKVAPVTIRNSKSV